MNMFANKVPSKIEQNTKSLENLSAVKAAQEHVEFILLGIIVGPLYSSTTT